MADGTCAVDGCDRVSEKREWCEKHYMRWWRHGDPLYQERVVLNGSPSERFWGHVDKSSGECWEWTASVFTQRYGYGKFNRGDRVVYAHRFAYEDQVGPIPDGLHVLHSCDNPPCVNPAHLRVGTHQDNMRDMVRRGRNRAQTHPESYPSGEAYWAQRKRRRADR